MKTRTLTSIAAITALGVLLPITSSHAFGLGKIELSSALNQPFKATIPVTALRPEEKGNLQVQLASGDEYIRAGIDRNYFLTQFKFEVIEDKSGARIEISSTQPVKEPFIDLLLTATAGQGRLIREYTVLLDPPKDLFIKPAVKAPVKSEVSTPSTSTNVAPTTSNSYVAPTTASKASKSYDGSTYKTSRNDTLWKVALETKQSDASVHQMMMALLNENPDAFRNQNINGLKAGKTLTIPSETVVKSLTNSQAIAAVSEQNTLWKNRNVKAKPVSETNVVVEQAPAAPAATATPENTAVESTIAQQDTSARLKLVAPSDDVVSEEADIAPMGDDELSKLSEQLTLAQETIETQSQENIDIKQRMAAMEEQIETLRRLLSLKDPDLAAIQSTLEDKQETIEAEEAVLATTEQVADEAVTDDVDTTDITQAAETAEAVIDEQDTQTPETSTDASTEEATVETPEPTVQDALSSVDGAIAYVSDVTGLDPEQAKSKFEQLKSYIVEHKNESTLVGLLLLLLVWLIVRFRNRRYVRWDDAVDNKETEKSEAPKPERPNLVDNTDVIDTDVPVVAAVSEPEQTVEQMIDDADVYVSYGDFAKAKQTLQTALVIEPANEIVMHKLLFVLFKQEDESEFISLAEQYQNDTEASEWDEVLSWGQELAPNEDLFQPVLKTMPQEELVEEETSAEPLDLTASDDIAGDTKPTTDDDLLSFDVNAQDDEAVEEITLDIPETESASSSDGRLDLADLDLTASADELSDVAKETDTSPMEFSLDIDEDTTEDAFELEGLETISEDDLSEATAALAADTDSVEQTLSTDDSELEFDLGDFDQVDEAETKLDLAAAYVDMGDPDGAKSILEEVLAEGSDEQKARAEAMLSDIK